MDNANVIARMIRDRIDATMAFCCVNRNSLCADAAMTHAEIIADAHRGKPSYM